jgi:type II secretory pathway pseudopilin PulG
MKPNQRPRRQRSCAAFTLVELLIATGITVAMVLMMGLMLGSLMGSASHTTARVDAFRDARAAMQMIERDFRNLVRTQWNPDPFANPPPASTQPVTRPAAYFALDKVWQDPNDPYTANDPVPNYQLFGLIADRTTPLSGDVCAVGYYCQWDNQLHAYTLRRLFRGPAETLAAMQGGGGSYVSDARLYDSSAPGARNDMLAAYVWNFKITMYDANGTVLNTYPYICDPSATTPKSLPAALEISFNAMSPQAARKVMSVTSDPSVWMNMDANLVKPHAYEFRSRINLP